MTRISPAKFVGKNKNAPSGGVAAPHATESIQTAPASQETVMAKSSPTLRKVAQA